MSKIKITLTYAEVSDAAAKSIERRLPGSKVISMNRRKGGEIEVEVETQEPAIEAAAKLAKQ